MLYNKLLMMGARLLAYKGYRVISTGEIKSFNGVGTELAKIFKSIIGPILTVIGVAGVIYAVYLGVMYAKAESADKRKEIQGRLIGACIGAVIIIVGAVLCFALDLNQIFHSLYVKDGHAFTDENKDGYCDLCKAAE